MLFAYITKIFLYGTVNVINDEKFWCGNLKERGQFRDQGADGRIILKRIL